MRTIIVHILAFSLLAAFIPGCKTNDKLRIGVCMGPLHERWIKDTDYLQHYLEAKGAVAVIVKAYGDEAEQTRQAKMLIDEEDIDVLIIIPINSETAGRIVDYAKGKGIKVIAYDRIVKNCELDFYISFDNVRVGEIQADYLTRIKPVGNYAILGGDPRDNNSILLKLGQMNILQPLVTKGDIKIVLDQNVPNWDSVAAYEIIRDFLEQNTKLDAIIASNDGLSGGACRALQERGLERKVLLSGQDAETEACKRIVQSHQTMTVYKVVESMAHSAANIAISLANGEALPNSQTTIFNGKMMVPAVLLSSMIPVAKENIRMTVIADGYLDEKVVFGAQ
jgi:D-xylose transport system substrate-binding protein